MSIYEFANIMKILITGDYRFIGFSFAETLIKWSNVEGLVIDNIKYYYDVDLNYTR